MKNNKLVIQISSLFPIDITEAIFSHWYSLQTASKEVTFEVLLNSELAMSEGAKNNSGTSRGSFPLFVQKMDGIFLWQQCHTSSCDGEILNEFNLFLDRLGCLLGEGSELPLERIGSLKALLIEKIRLSPTTISWGELLEIILKEVFSRLGVSGASFRDNSEARINGVLTTDELIYLENFIVSLPPGRAIEFIDGGKINISVDGDRWSEIKAVRFEGSRNQLYLLPEIEEDDEIKIHIDDLRNFRWRLRGMLENVLLGYGVRSLSNLPWYVSKFMEAELTESGCLEFISPYSVKAYERIDCALTPKGYSLIDYGSDYNVKEFCNTLLSFSIEDPFFVQDYNVINTDLPPSKQRYAKDQHALRGLVRSMEADFRKRFREEGAELLDLRQSKSFASFGRFCFTVSGLLELAAPSEWKDVKITDGAEAQLAELLQWDRGGYKSIGDNIQQLISRFRFHTGVSTKSIDLSEIDSDLIKLRDSLNRIEPGDSGKSIAKVFLEARRLFIKLSMCYYSWLISMLSGVLKAHILPLYILLGKEGLHRSFNEIIDKRSQVNSKRYLSFNPVYF